MAEHRSTLIALNTVDRLLRGDFFHTVALEDVFTELREFPPEWPVSGLGTTNWYGRNGEIVIEGTAGEPSLLWSDPGTRSPGRVINLLTGLKRELVPVLAAHVDVDALDTWGVAAEQQAEVEIAAAESIKRIARKPRGITDAAFDWTDDRAAQRPEWIAAFLEMKTVWHPIGA